MSRHPIAFAFVMGALITYGMGAVSDWSLNPGDWNDITRRTMIIPIWPLVSAVVGVVMHLRDDL